MSHTGSTYARNWPTRWGPRLRLALVASVLLATMTAARASWIVRDVTGTPNDVRVWAPGVYSVSTNMGAYLFQADGGVESFPSPVGYMTTATRLTNSGCFAVYVNNDTVIRSPTDCTGPSVVWGDSSVQMARMKTAESGASYALGKGALLQTWTAFSPTEMDAWEVGATQFTGTPMAVGAVSQGSSAHALLAVGTMQQVDFYWLTNGITNVAYGIPDSITPPREVQAIDLFPGGGANPSALFGWGGDLYRGPLVNATQHAFVKVPLPARPGTVTGVDVNTGSGSVYGDGFGMVTVQHDGGVTLLSAVPAGQPQDVGLQWRVNPTIPDAGAARYLSCQGARTCVIAQRLPPPGNLLVYTNASPPTLTTDGRLDLPEETTDQPFAIRASDPDGDPVRVTVSPSSAPELTFTQREVDGGVDLTLAAGRVCQNTPAPIDVVASDGLADHDQLLTLPFQVIHTRRPEPPRMSSTTLVVQAGELPRAITAEDPLAPSCAISGFRWSSVSLNAPQLDGGTNGERTVAFPTPESLCDPNGASHVYAVASRDLGGLVSNPLYFTVQVRPWGKPHAPFSADRHETLLAGDVTAGSLRLTPEKPVHPCVGSSTAFPDVDTLWELDGGAPLPPGIQLLTSDRTVITATRAFTSDLLIETAACASADLEFSVQHFTRDGSGIAGPRSNVYVRVESGWLPVDKAGLEVSMDPVTPERVSGQLKVSNLNCIEERGGVTVRIRLTGEDGSVIEQDFPIPGSGERAWQVPLSPTCEGRTYHLQAELVGRPGVFAQDVPVPPFALQLEPPEAPRLVAHCGGAAQGTLEQRLPAGPCEALPLTWERLSGPELTQETFTGQRIDVTTKETDFGELIGQNLVMRVTTGTGAQVEQTIPITAEPFVSVERHVENAVGTSTDLIGVSVELGNLTSCGVRQVDQTEFLEGADYVPGSARFNDVPVEQVEVQGDALTLRGLVLEGNSVGRLTYVVRPRLLGKTRFEGQSFVRGIPVSQPLVVPVSGCGCEGGGSGFAALGLAGLAAALRRRRAR